MLSARTPQTPLGEEEMREGREGGGGRGRREGGEEGRKEGRKRKEERREGRKGSNTYIMYGTFSFQISES